MAPIAKVTLVNLSKKMVSKKGSAVEELVQKAMSDLGGVTPTKAKKVLPKTIEGDQFIQGEKKVKVSNDSGCPGFDNSWY